MPASADAHHSTGMHSWQATDGGYGTVRASRRQNVRLLEAMVRVRDLISWRVDARLLFEWFARLEIH